MLAAWQPPPEAKRIIVFGDNDPSYAGQAAAYALARRLGSDERLVEVQIPAEVSADWNDVHQLRRYDLEGPTMAERVGQGTLTGRWEPRPGACANIRGGITIERDLPVKTKLWLTGWTKTIAGGALVSLLMEFADEGGRQSP
jgi:Toprim domain